LLRNKRGDKPFWKSARWSCVRKGRDARGLP
jgi:hypothetical protein